MLYLEKNIAGIKYAIPADILKIFFGHIALWKVNEEVTKIGCLYDNPSYYQIDVPFKTCMEWVNEQDDRFLSKLKEAGCDVGKIICSIKRPIDLRQQFYQNRKKSLWKRIFG